MPDRDKVIETCKKCINSGNPAMDYHFYYEVLALLKEQEAQKPNILQDTEGIWTVCRKCGAKLWPMFGGWTIKHDPAELPKYCQRCGQAVKWNA